MCKHLIFALSLTLTLGCSSEPHSKSSVAPDASPLTQRPHIENDRSDVLDCADCHPDEATAWASQPMGRSISRVVPERLKTEAKTAVVHHKTQERFTVRLERDRLVFEGPNGVRRPADWTIGSGAHTHSFATEIHGGLQMLPLTWYTSKQSWQMSPGYETEKHPGFHRAVNTECLYCHSRQVPEEYGDSTRFDARQIGPIECIQCHRDAQKHARSQSLGKQKSVGVPSKLTPELSADICGYCHLQGPARLLRDGRSWGDFKPGDRLGDTVAVFAYERPSAEFGIVGQAERLRRSRCATVDRRAGTCITCHTPHSVTASPPEQACVTCHQENGHSCSGSKKQQCAECHMARAQTQDIPHVSMTDHFIRRRPTELGSPKERGPLRWVNRPNGVSDVEASSLLGRAYAEVARRTGSAADRDTAIRYLEASLKLRPESPRGWFDLASMRRARGDAAGANSAAESAFARSPSTPKFAMAVAQTRIAAGKFADAKSAAFRAAKLAPNTLEPWVLQAQIAITQGDEPLFRKANAQVRRLRPKQGVAANLEGVWLLSRRQLSRAIRAFEEAIRQTPHSRQYLNNLCKTLVRAELWKQILKTCDGEQRASATTGYLAWALLKLGRDAEAAKAALRAMSTGSPEANYVLGHLAMKSNRLEESAEFLGRAAQAMPSSQAPLRDLITVLTQLNQTRLAEAARERLLRIEAQDKASPRP